MPDQGDEPKRRVEMLRRELDSMRLPGPVFHSNVSPLAAQDHPALLRLIEGLLRKKKDEYGPYVEGTSPVVAYWALRVELDPGKGDWTNLESWRYFGLHQSKGVCSLSDEAFFYPDGRDRLWDRTTSIPIDGIEKKAEQLIADAGRYELLGNNCQNFAAALLVSAESEPIRNAQLYRLVLCQNLCKLVDPVTYGFGRGEAAAKQLASAGRAQSSDDSDDSNFLTGKTEKAVLHWQSNKSKSLGDFQIAESKLVDRTLYFKDSILNQEIPFHAEPEYVDAMRKFMKAQRTWGRVTAGIKIIRRLMRPISEDKRRECYAFLQAGRKGKVSWRERRKADALIRQGEIQMAMMLAGIDEEADEREEAGGG